MRLKIIESPLMVLDRDTPGEPYCRCGHAKHFHHKGLGMCDCTIGRGYSSVCDCRRFAKRDVNKIPNK